MNDVGGTIEDIKENILTITLNRPERLNAVNPPLFKALVNAIRASEENDEARVVVLKGSGRAFCAGVDMINPSPRVRDVQAWRRKFFDEVGLFRLMLNLSKPTIALVRGYALGFGFWLMNTCDMAIASADCKFGVPEIRQGSAAFRMLIPANVPRNRAFELMTGDFFDGKAAESMGLVTRSVSSADLETEVYRLAKKLALIDPKVMTMNKQALNAWYGLPDLDLVMKYQVENGAVLYSSEPFMRWSKLAREVGMREYLKMRDDPFKQLDRQPGNPLGDPL